MSRIGRSVVERVLRGGYGLQLEDVCINCGLIASFVLPALALVQGSMTWPGCARFAWLFEIGSSRRRCFQRSRVPEAAAPTADRSNFRTKIEVPLILGPFVGPLCSW